MTDLANLTDLPLPGPADAPLPGPLVRDLVAWTERDIDALQRELDAAQQEAEFEESRLRRHPAAHMVTTTSARASAPARQAPDSSSAVDSDAALTLDRWDPVDGPADRSALSAPALPPSTASLSDGVARSPGNRLPPGVAPRTTVVRRDPPVTDPEPVDVAADAAASTDPLRPATRREILHGRRGSWTDRLKGHWMMKAGMAIALLGLVLLKLG